MPWAQQQQRSEPADYLKSMLLQCIEDGVWLTLNFGFSDVDLSPFIEHDNFPFEVLNPKLIYGEQVLHRLAGGPS